MSKKIRIIKQGGNLPVHVVARARGKKVNHANAPAGGTSRPFGQTLESYLGADDDYPTNNTDTTTNNKIVQTNPEKVTKTEFYTFRDSVYKMMDESGKNYKGLQGNPFNAFSHGVIKDSPLKNYAKELTAFKQMVKEYFPEVYAEIQNKSYQSEKQKVIDRALAIDVEETLKDVSADYIRTLEAKQATGSTLSKAEQNILKAYYKLQDELRGGAKRQIQSDIMDWLEENWYIVLGGIIILIILLKKK